MRRKVIKGFMLWNFDKEEKWLNEMSAKGLHLVGVGFCTYVFEEGTPGEYTVKLELLDQLPGHCESRRYIEFIEDTGAEYIGSLTRWVYFRKRAEYGGFDLFSDIDSRLNHMNRVLCLNALVLPLISFSTWNTLNRYFYEDSGVAMLVLGLLCGALALMGFYGLIRIYLKRRKLKKEREIHE